MNSKRCNDVIIFSVFTHIPMSIPDSNKSWHETSTQLESIPSDQQRDRSVFYYLQNAKPEKAVLRSERIKVLKTGQVVKMQVERYA